MKKIIYSSNFTNYQKLILILFFTITFFIGMIYFLGLLLWVTGNFMVEGTSYVLTDFFFVLSLPISFIFLILLLSKKGILIKGGQLYSAQFLFKNVIRKKKVSLEEVTDISILTFKGVQKFAWSSMARPDQGYEVKRFELYLLNKKHTVKKYLIATQKEKLANDSIEIIKEHFDLDFNLYDPRF